MLGFRSPLKGNREGFHHYVSEEQAEEEVLDPGGEMGLSDHGLQWPVEDNDQPPDDGQ